jgi:two-component system CheB/CheR fusion protein
MKAKPPPGPSSQRETCLIVGIGASAGGLESFTKLLEHLPEDSGMAFVFIQHMDPTHESLLTTLLSKKTRMPVSQITHHMAIEPNCVYVIPPDTNLFLKERRFQLEPRLKTQSPPMAIDSFFRSLADHEKENAIGVILSGTGSDGALGAAAIKAAGGVVFAQDGATAKYNGMPHSAAAAGCVDFILPPEGIAKKLLRIKTHPDAARSKESGVFPESSPQERNSLNRIFTLLRTLKDIDFSLYKPSTIQRRLMRRITLHRIDDLENYVELLHKQPSELEALYKDFLINVTKFFRDPEVFETLERTVFPEFIKNHRSSGTPLRVWVPGCSTGEEAYSLAISLLEFLGKRSASRPVQIFATDVSDGAIDTARAGRYLENIVADVKPEYLRRYFTRTADGYQVNKTLRDRIIFAKHNLLTDPPFAKLDLISCRNVMIYLEHVLQKSILPLLHFALQPGGFLLLGSAENICASPLFTTVDKTCRIYAKVTGTHTNVYLPASRQMPEKAKTDPAGSPQKPERFKGFDPEKEADHIIQNLYSPAGILVSGGLEIIQFRGDVTPYLKPMTGKASLDLVKMLPGSLSHAVQSLIEDCRKKKTSIHKAGIHIKIRDQWKDVTLQVFPIQPGVSIKERCFLLLFEVEIPPKSAQSRVSSKKTRPESAVRELAELKKKLFSTEAHLQSIIESGEALNEELQATNEEILSSNEELQATNEELETTKEELQSTNEELTTLNDELKNSNQNLSDSRDFNQSIVDALREPMMILNEQLRVIQANPAFYQFFKTSREAIENQFIYELGNQQWEIPALRTLLEGILPKNERFDNYQMTHDFPLIGVKTLLLNARRLKSALNMPRMILLMIEDVTQRSALEQAEKLESVGRLAGGVAHDFNNLITGILGILEDIRNELGSESSHRKDLDIAIQASRKTSALTKQLLAFARRQVIAPRVLNLNHVIHGMDALLRRLLEERIELKLALDPELGNIQADQANVEQVIVNLALNARDAMPGGGRITLETANMDLAENGSRRTLDLPAGSYVVFSVSDTGHGMDEKMMRRIFEPFFTTKEAGKGTGLGLATVYGIIKQNAGEIRVESEPGHGTTFRIYLPRVREDEQTERRLSPRGGVRQGSETILVVEDEDIVRRVVTNVLRKNGYTVLEARNGEEALKICETHSEPIQLLLTDVIMPGLDGRALATRLTNQRPAMSVLYTSGYPQEIITQHGNLEPDIAFIEKSFSPEALCRKVREVLDAPKKGDGPDV